MSKILVAYHYPCLDGFTSAWITVRALERQQHSVSIIAMAYNDASLLELQKTLGRFNFTELWVVDFSLDIHILELFETTFPGTQITILDHHKTAFEKYAPEMEIVRDSCLDTVISGAEISLDNNECGASICWEYFYSEDTNIPSLVKYVKDYDLWRFEYGDDTRYINKYLMTQEKTLSNWDDLADRLEHLSLLTEIIVEGRTLQMTHDTNVANIAKNARLIVLAGKEGLGVYCPPELTSDVGHALATTCGTFGAMYYRDDETKEVKWGLRSSGEYDVSAIAKRHGGGGHINAAGFVVDITAPSPAENVTKIGEEK